MENDHTPDPYDAVLADLRAKRDRIDNTIALLESLRASGVAAPGAGLVPKAETKPKEAAPQIGPGAFFGMTVHDAAIKLLRSRRQEMQTSELVPELERGGIRLTSADKINTVGSILLRRFNQVGDIVRVGRGRWGLQEWYPGRKFPGSKNRANDTTKGDEAEHQETAAGNEEGTASDKPTAGSADWVDRVIGNVSEEPAWDMPDEEPNEEPDEEPREEPDDEPIF